MKYLDNSRYMQYLSSLLATITIANDAMYLSWSSPTLPKLTSTESPIGVTLTPEEASWAASAPLLSALPSFFLVSWTMEKYGCKNSLLLAAIPLFVPWIIIAFANSAELLIVLRFIGGIGGSMAATAVTIYIAEIADKDIRGKLGTAYNMLRLTGSLYVLSVGPFISYKALTLSCSVVPLIFLVTFYFMPDSPYFLIEKNKRNLAYDSIKRFSNKNVTEKCIEDKITDIEFTLKSNTENKTNILNFFFKKKYQKTLIIMLGIKTLQQLSGIYAIEAYLQTIIESSESSISPEISSILCGVIQIPAVLIAASLVDKMGRKPLLLISSFGCSIALIGEGLYFYFQDVLNTDVSNISWLPTTCLLVFIIMNPIGLFTLPSIILGEIFAPDVKGIAVATSTLYGSFLGFLVIKMFDPISQAWGMHTMFWIFAGMTVVLSMCIFLGLPETKGKTFAEIQILLKS